RRGVVPGEHEGEQRCLVGPRPPADNDQRRCQGQAPSTHDYSLPGGRVSYRLRPVPESRSLSGAAAPAATAAVGRLSESSGLARRLGESSYGAGGTRGAIPYNNGMLTTDPHPLLDLRAFVTTFPRPLGEMASPPELLALLSLEAPAPLRSDDTVRET